MPTHASHGCCLEPGTQVAFFFSCFFFGSGCLSRAISPFQEERFVWRFASAISGSSREGRSARGLMATKHVFEIIIQDACHRNFRSLWLTLLPKRKLKSARQRWATSSGAALRWLAAPPSPSPATSRTQRGAAASSQRHSAWRPLHHSSSQLTRRRPRTTHFHSRPKRRRCLSSWRQRPSPRALAAAVESAQMRPLKRPLAAALAAAAAAAAAASLARQRSSVPRLPHRLAQP